MNPAALAPDRYAALHTTLAGHVVYGDEPACAYMLSQTQAVYWPPMWPRSMRRSVAKTGVQPHWAVTTAL